MNTHGADSRPALAGAAWAVSAFGLWGALPLYFRAVEAAPPLEVLAHRVVWSVFWIALLLTVLRGWPAVRGVFADRRLLARLAVSALLISANWLIFIWAIATERVLEASLGYFITPLVNVVLGRLVLGEALTRVQWAAVGLAAAGVGWMLLRAGTLPWVGLALALLFGAYGLMRKTAPVGAMSGLFAETALLAPLALAWLAWLGWQGTIVFGSMGIEFDLLLAAAGLVTAVPLLLFARAAQGLRLASLGFFQYITPTGQMLVALFIFGELFTAAHAVTFGCIWLALALYSAGSWRNRRELAPTVRDV